MWLRLIIEVLLLSLSAISVVSILRAFSPIQALVRAKRKPWSCDTCLSFWAVVFLAVVVILWPAAKGLPPVEPTISLAILPAHGLTLAVLSKLRAPDLTELFSTGIEVAPSARPTQDDGSWPVGGALEGEKR